MNSSCTLWAFSGARAACEGSRPPTRDVVFSPDTQLGRVFHVRGKLPGPTLERALPLIRPSSSGNCSLIDANRKSRENRSCFSGLRRPLRDEVRDMYAFAVRTFGKAPAIYNLPISATNGAVLARGLPSSILSSTNSSKRAALTCSMQGPTQRSTQSITIRSSSSRQES
jgi:hypothetical protein